MRYAQGGGLTAGERAVRERMRLEAVERFGRGEKSAVIARDLRVSTRSVERWRRSWREGGADALRSKGPASLPRLDQRQFALLEAGWWHGPDPLQGMAEKVRPCGCQGDATDKPVGGQAGVHEAAA
jgi:hypothetical protein